MIKSFFSKNYRRIIILFTVSLLIAAFYLSIKKEWAYAFSYIDAFTVSGFIIILVGGLVLVSGFGGFNIFSYYVGRKQKSDGKKETYGDYSSRKNEEGKSSKQASISYFLVGLFNILIAVILLLIFS